MPISFEKISLDIWTLAKGAAAQSLPCQDARFSIFHPGVLPVYPDSSHQCFGCLLIASESHLIDLYVHTDFAADELR